MNRINAILKDLIGIEDPDDLMQEILSVLTETEIVPQVGGIYTFVYSAKTPNIQYDQYPLVGVTDVFSWGFVGNNFHWGITLTESTRQYTWQEIVGSLHVVRNNELRDLMSIPYGSIKLNT